MAPARRRGSCADPVAPAQPRLDLIWLNAPSRPSRHSTLGAFRPVGHAGVARSRRERMRLATAPAAPPRMLGPKPAYANQYVGTITEMRADGRTFMLDDGNVYKLDTNAPR